MLGGANSWAGDIALPGTAAVNVGGGQLTLAGTISGPGGLTKSGAGTLLVNGVNNTLAGLTTVAVGTLGGTGKLGRVAVSAGAHLAPGAGGPGILSVGNVNFAAGSFFDVIISGSSADSGYSQLVSAGAVALNKATLNLLLGSYTPSTPTTFTIISRASADAANSTFAGLPENTTFTVGANSFNISYLGGTGHHDVVLSV